MPISDISIATSSGLSGLSQAAQDFLRAVTSPELQRQLFAMKLVFVTFSIGFLIIIAYMLLNTSYLEWKILGDIKNFFFPHFFDKRSILKNWSKIKQQLQKESEPHWKLSVIEASHFLDKILESMGYSGENLSDRIQKITSDEVSNFTDLSQASKACQDIVRDPDYKLSNSVAKGIVNTIEKSLIDLEVL